MDRIDEAFEKLNELIPEINNYKDSIITEQDTRVKVVDRMLIEVLGWPHNEIYTEAEAGGGYIDYKLMVQGLSRAIVEAKRDARTLGIENRISGHHYKLNGPVFTTDAAKEGIYQAIRYCGHKNAELACVTNGHEWIIFRGSRLGDGRDSLEGAAFIFPSLESVKTQFRLFFDLLSYEAVNEFRYRAFFQEAEGRPVRTQPLRKQLRPQETRRLLPHDKLFADLDRVMTSFFRRLSGDEDSDLLARCFVTTRESQIADERLARVSEDLVAKVRDIDTYSGSQLTEIVDRVRSTQKNEFVLLVGTKGAGKSTFIDRFFRQILPEQIAALCIVVRVDLGDSPGDESAIVSWLDQHLLEGLEIAIFPDNAPEFDEIQGMFFDEYQRRSKGTLKFLYETNKEEFKIDFGRHIEKWREERPHDYIKRLVHHIARSRLKVPCLVFDNADHFTIEFQERVFQYARSIYESELSLILVPITDRTSWQLSREGALRSFENDSLFLPTPPPEVVLKKRIDYLQDKLTQEKREPGHGYFLKRGIALSIDNLTAFTSALQSVFLGTGRVSLWIGNLANYDIRRCLEIAKFLISSPHLEVHELIKSYIAESSIYIPLYKVIRAMIKGQYDIYSSDLNPYIRNIYAIDEGIEGSPLMGLRLLRLLRDFQKTYPKDPFIEIQQIVDYFSSMLIEASLTIKWLSKLLESGLCLSYDPTVISINAAARVESSPAGIQHLRWGIREQTYTLAMMEVMPISDSEAYDELYSLYQQPPVDTWHQRLDVFVDYLINEDEKYCRIPNHDSYKSQRELSTLLKRLTNQRSSSGSD